MQDKYSKEPSRSFPLLPLVILLLGTLALVAFGFLGLGRGDSTFAFDMRYLYVAGEMWEQGHSPYEIDRFKNLMQSMMGVHSVSYAYPPNSAFLALFLSAGSLDFAKWLIAAINVVALSFLVAFIHAGAFARVEPADRHRGRMWADFIIAAAIVIGNPFTSHVIWMGQTTLVSAALLLGSWFMAERQKDLGAGILLGLSAFKPQLAFLVGIWFLLDRRWSLLLTACVTTLSASIVPIISNGFGGSWLTWLEALKDYQVGTNNMISFRHVIGIRSTLASLGFEVPSLLPVAVISIFALYLARRRYETTWIVCLILIISFLLLYAHDYDMAPATILAYPLLRATHGRMALLILVAFFALILFFPQRIWESTHLGDLARSRELALLGIAGIYLVYCRAPGKIDPIQEDPPKRTQGKS